MTTTPVPDEELTPLEECRPFDVLEDELDVVAPAVVDACDVDGDVPGMVAALTALKTPTPTTAPIAAPVVRRFSRRIPESLVRILASIGAVLFIW